MQIALLAFALAAASPADVDAYIKVSGLTAQMRQTPQMVISGLDDALAKNGAPVDAELVAGLRKAISEVYAADRVVAGIRAQLLENGDPAALRKTLDFYKTPLALKVTELEVAVSTAEGMAEVREARQRARPRKVGDDQLLMMMDLG